MRLALVGSDVLNCLGRIMRCGLIGGGMSLEMGSEVSKTHDISVRSQNFQDKWL